MAIWHRTHLGATRQAAVPAWAGCARPYHSGVRREEALTRAADETPFPGRCWPGAGFENGFGPLVVGAFLAFAFHGHESIMTDRFPLHTQHPTPNVQLSKRMLRPNTPGGGSAEEERGQLIISICRVQGQGEHALSYCGRRQWFVCWDANHSPGASLDAVSTLSRLRLALQERQAGPSASEREPTTRLASPSPRRWGACGWHPRRQRLDCIRGEGLGGMLVYSSARHVGSRAGAIGSEHIRLPGTSAALALLLEPSALESWSNPARQPTRLPQTKYCRGGDRFARPLDGG